MSTRPWKPWTKADRCGATNKVRYRSKGAALEVLKVAEAARTLPENAHRREQRAYECVNCGGWHLTSQERSSL